MILSEKRLRFSGSCACIHSVDDAGTSAVIGDVNAVQAAFNWSADILPDLLSRTIS